MTEKEEIKVIKELVFCGICTTGPCDQCGRRLAKDAALAALEEIQQYRAIGTVEECQEAVERQKEKRPIDDTEFGICPHCHNEFNSELVNEYNMKHCLYCGQAILWENDTK